MKRNGILIAVTTTVLTLVLASCGGISQGIKGKLVDAIFNDPVKNIQVKLVYIDQKQTSDKPMVFMVDSNDGEFQKTLEPGRYRIELEDISQDFKYARQVGPFTIEPGKVFEMTYKMDPIIKQWIHGQALEKETKKPIPDAKISFSGLECTTNKKGEYSLKNFRPGMVKVEITAKGYAPYVNEYRMSEGETIEDFELTPTGYIEGAKVNTMADLISYVIEVSTGTDFETIKSVDSIVLNNAPLSIDLITGKDEYITTIGKFFKKTGDKWAEISKGDFDKSVEVPYTKAYDRFKSAFKQFNDLKKTISKDVVEIESANLVNYTYQATFEGATFDCNLWLYFDGNFMGYPTKLTMKSGDKYYEYSFSKFNSPENRINAPEIK